MRAMILRRTVKRLEDGEPLELVDLPVPQPQEGEVLLRVSACGVCHTELDQIEGRVEPTRLPIVPGHEVVGTVVSVRSATSLLQCGDRVGVGWIFRSSGEPTENLSPQFLATGRDVNGGYAEYMTAPAAYTVPIPDGYADAEAAPLLCAGAIGYRAFRLSGIKDGQSLGLTGFGASAHLVLQMVRHRLPRASVFVFARGNEQRAFAMQLGAVWAGEISDRAPQPLDAIIDTTPAWKPVVEALANLRPGGRLVMNAIRKEDDDKDYLLNLRYHEHLWMEREIKSVANITGRDLREFLPLAAEIPIRPEVTTYPLEEANRALRDLKQGHGRGAKVLLMR